MAVGPGRHEQGRGSRPTTMGLQPPPCRPAPPAPPEAHQQCFFGDERALVAMHGACGVARNIRRCPKNTTGWCEQHPPPAAQCALRPRRRAQGRWSGRCLPACGASALGGVVGAGPAPRTVRSPARSAAFQPKVVSMKAVPAQVAATTSRGRHGMRVSVPPMDVDEQHQHQVRELLWHTCTEDAGPT